MEYKVIRHHRRKQTVISVNPMGQVSVKTGIFTSDKAIKEYINKNLKWIETQKEYFANKYHHRIIINKNDIKSVKKEFYPEIKRITDKYAQLMNVNPKHIKITSAENRWGSCSADKAICYSYRCAFLSQRCKEYIVVHELSHIKELNHSKNFYNVVKEYMPDYKEAEKELDGYYIHAE